MNTFLKTAAAFVGVLVLWTLLVTLPVQLLWNWLCPVLFGLPKISFLQTMGLLLLVNFIFNRNGGKAKQD
jgi:putative flippase GtrA